MLRACFIVVAVAVLSASVAHLRDAQGEGTQANNRPPIRWVRTVDGWEPASVLTPSAPPPGPPTLHPVVVATLQVGVSVFALLALPTSTALARKSRS